MAGIEELLAGRITPSSLMQSLQSDYTTYWSSQSELVPASPALARGRPGTQVEVFVRIVTSQGR
jgi:hypothetical protein